MNLTLNFDATSKSATILTEAVLLQRITTTSIDEEHTLYKDYTCPSRNLEKEGLLKHTTVRPIDAIEVLAQYKERS